MIKCIPFPCFFSGLLILLASVPGVCLGGVFDTRIAERPHCKSFLDKLTPAGMKVWGSASILADKLQRMPTLDEFAELHLSAPNPLTDQDVLSLFYCFGTIQKASLSNKQLATLYEARRENLSAIHATWTTSSQGGPASSPEGEVKNCSAVYAKSGVLLRVDFPSIGQSRTLTHANGVFREFVSTGNGSRFGTVDSNGSIESFFPLDSPIVLMGVVDWQKEVLSPLLEPLDVRTAILRGFTYESPIEFDGQNCLVGGSIENRYFFSLEHEFSLKGAQLNKLTFDATTGVYRENSEVVTLIFRDFHAVGENIYVPFHHVREFQNTNDGKQKVTTQLDTCTINDPVKDGTFTDIFPDGAIVCDSIQNATFVVGQDVNLGSNLPVKSKGVSRNLMLTINAVFISLLAFWLLLKKRWRAK